MTNVGRLYRIAKRHTGNRPARRKSETVISYYAVFLLFLIVALCVLAAAYAYPCGWLLAWGKFNRTARLLHGLSVVMCESINSLQIYQRHYAETKGLS